MLPCAGAAVPVPRRRAGRQRAITSVPPAEYRPAIVSRASAALTLGTGAPAHRVELVAPAASELAALKARNSVPRCAGEAREQQGARRRIRARHAAAAARNVSLSALTWVTTSDGGRSARIEIRSPDAAALRVALQLPATDPDLTVRFAGSGAGASVFGAGSRQRRRAGYGALRPVLVAGTRRRRRDDRIPRGSGRRARTA